MKFERIVVGVDFSPIGLAAIDHAAALAHGGQLELVHVLDTDRIPPTPLFDDEAVALMRQGLEADARQVLNELSREVASEHVRVAVRLLSGRPADELLHACAGADLLVLAAHSKGAFDRFALGSVSEEVVRRSATPVLVVREKAEGTTKFARVIAAVDLEDPCPPVLAAAGSLAARTSARLVAAHVVRWPVPPAGRSGAHGLPQDLAARVRSDAERAVRGLVSTTLGSAVAVEVAFGSPAEEIGKLARKDDVIVTGTHGRGTLGRLAFGSVATKLLRAAPCPVLVLRPDAVAPAPEPAPPGSALAAGGS